jgi:hypothetical protein
MVYRLDQMVSCGALNSLILTENFTKDLYFTLKDSVGRVATLFCIRDFPDMNLSTEIYPD